jgi:hypothetical protein
MNEPGDFVSDKFPIPRSRPADKMTSFEPSHGHLMMVVLELCMPVTFLQSLLYLITSPGLEVLGPSKKQSRTGNSTGKIRHLTPIPLDDSKTVIR